MSICDGHLYFVLTSVVCGLSYPRGPKVDKDERPSPFITTNIEHIVLPSALRHNKKSCRFSRRPIRQIKPISRELKVSQKGSPAALPSNRSAVSLSCQSKFSRQREHNEFGLGNSAPVQDLLGHTDSTIPSLSSSSSANKAGLKPTATLTLYLGMLLGRSRHESLTYLLAVGNRPVGTDSEAEKKVRSERTREGETEGQRPAARIASYCAQQQNKPGE